MKIQRTFFLFVLAIAFPFLFLHADFTYDVQIHGVQDPKLEEILKASSQLLNFSEHTAVSIGVLKRRGEADVENFVKILHGLAHYNAKVRYSIDKKRDPIQVVFTIEEGPVYPLADFRIVAVPQEPAEPEGSCSQENTPFSYDKITLEDLGITLGTPAYAESILQAEEKLLKMMAEQGYPRAAIQKRQVVADQMQKDLHVTLVVDSGPLAYFGTTTITGNKSVKEVFFCKKIAWREGESFNLCDIQTTQEALEASGLFSSTHISQGEVDPVSGQLPIEIQVNEAKHRTIASGVSYTTQRGPGVLLEWEHRNISGLGDKLNLRADVWETTQEGKISYLLPDFKKKNQDLLLQADLKNENIKAYSETSFSLSGVIDKKIGSRLKVSYGLMYRSILTRRSDNNGHFQLLKVPLQLHWNAANCPLDPTSGYSIHLKSVPSLQLKPPHFAYCPTTFISTFYLPFQEDHRFVVAGKLTVGSIFGTSRHTIPPSERFYAGNENTLRGYGYETVSPLKDHKPIGGRSIMVLSLEARMRLSETLGLVGFYEIGNVYSSPAPQFNHEQLQSAGVGVRYHTAVGPIRLDFAFPLNRRPKVDGPFQAYLSIGQSF